MAKTRTAAEALGLQTPEPLAGQEVLEGMEVTPDSESQLMPFRPLAASQWRRPLREDEMLPYIKDLVSGSLGEDDPRAIMEVLGQIARATTFDEAMGGGDTTKGREVLDTILEVWGYKFNKSTEPRGCPYYVLLDAKDTRTGKVELVSVGGWKVVGTCAWAHYAASDLAEGDPRLVPEGTPRAIGHMPFPHYFKIRKVDTSSGNTMNLIVPTTA